MSNEAIVDEEPSINPAPIGMAANDDGFTLDELLTMLQVGKRRFSLHPVAVLPDKCCC